VPELLTLLTDFLFLRVSYSITFPIIIDRPKKFREYFSVYERYRRPVQKTGKLILESDSISIDLHSQGLKKYNIPALTDLALYYYSYDQHSLWAPLGARILPQGDKNFLDFKYDGARHSYEFYIEKEVYVERLKEILSCWYKNGHHFSEYYGELPSYLLKHKHLIEGKKSNGEN
jgi:hypothetical protein